MICPVRTLTHCLTIPAVFYFLLSWAFSRLSCFPLSLAISVPLFCFPASLTLSVFSLPSFLSALESSRFSGYFLSLTHHKNLPVPNGVGMSTVPLLSPNPNRVSRSKCGLNNHLRAFLISPNQTQY